mgnify:CR=1 FL=1
MFRRESKPQNRIDSLIGATTRIEGNVFFSGGLRIDGAVRGNVAALPDQPGTVVGLHPEGTRGKGPDPYTFLPAQPGVGKLALVAEIPRTAMWKVSRKTIAELVQKAAG